MDDKLRGPNPASHSDAGGALSGIRVLDLSRVLAGPWCGQNLADLGADVIKVERPDVGDDTRSWGPPYLKDANGDDTTEAAYYLSANRGKKSVTIDITTPEGQAQVQRLAAESDIVLENYKVGQLARYGLDYPSLEAINPRLIYCSITGFGQTGPWAHRPGYDFIIQGLSGFMSVTGERDGMPGAGPQKAGIAVSDLFTGMYATVAVLAALHHRDVSGHGQYIDIALLDCMVSTMANMNTNYLCSGVAPVRYGNAHQNVVPYQTFECADGHIIIAIGNDNQLRKFSEAAGIASLADDERFKSNSLRIKNRAVLIPMMEAVTKTRTKMAWSELLEKAGVPYGPINRLDEVYANPQVQARGLRIDLPHPTGGVAKLVGNPIRLSRTPVRYRSAPPLLGQHNEEILGRVVAREADNDGSY
jgi:formyl-CoA transferase